MPLEETDTEAAPKAGQRELNYTTDAKRRRLQVGTKAQIREVLKIQSDRYSGMEERITHEYKH